MPTLHSINNAITDVVVQRGPLKITFHCLLEKYGCEDTSYEELQDHSNELLRQWAKMVGRLQSLRDDDSRINAPVPDGDREREPTDDERQDRLDEMIEEANKITKEMRKNELARLRNKVERILALSDPAAGWDVTEEDNGSVIPMTAAALMKRSPTFINDAISAIEGAVFNPFPE